MVINLIYYIIASVSIHAVYNIHKIKWLYTMLLYIIYAILKY